MYMNEFQVRDILNQTCEKMDMGQAIADRIKIKYSCAKTFYGQAVRTPKCFGPNGIVYDLEIRLSKPLMSAVGENETRNTIIHEFCHILDGEINGRMDGHGSNWRFLMRQAGIDNPQVCGPKVDMIGLEGMVKAQCPCGVVAISKNRATRMSKGCIYRCVKCMGKITVV